MSRKGARPIVFVCASVLNNVLRTKIITASSESEAGSLFKENFGYEAQEILGPFLKKRNKIIEPTRELKFTNQIKKAIYGDWLVNAFLLTDPKDQAYLVFLKRADDKKMSLPKGIITVPISDLRFM